MKLKYAFQRGVASALIAGVVLTAGLPALASSGAELAHSLNSSAMNKLPAKKIVNSSANS